MTERGQALRISIVHPEREARERWRRVLKARLPQAQVGTWSRPRAAARAAAGAAAGDPADANCHAEGGAGEHAPPASPALTHFGVGWKPPLAFFAEHPELAAFFAAGAGVDHLLGLDGLPPHLPIIRLEDAGMADQMFNYCLHEILRRVTRADEYEASQRAGRWCERQARPASDLRIGVLGMGALGGELARRLAALGFQVSGFARGPHEVPGVSCLHGAAQWPDFLARSDVLVLMAPLTADTRGIIDARALAALPAGAWLINVARGALIDEAALLAALAGGRLAGATLDVFQTEPLPGDHPFWRHPSIRLTPHVAAQTLIDPSARQVADKILRLQQGESVSGIVSRQRGY